MRGVTRRAFLRTTGLAAGSLVLGCGTTPETVWQDRKLGDERALFDAFLAIGTDGRIVVQAHKVEMGQGTHTAFATLVGEELRVDPRRIEVVAAPISDAFGGFMDQSTGGSTSLLEIWQPLRETGARARTMLVEAAAERWQRDASDLEVVDGSVVDPRSGASLSFAELSVEAAGRRAPREVALTPRGEWKYIGRRGVRVDARAKVTGHASYGLDVRVPDMQTAVVVHCPHAQGSLVSFDDEAARGVNGVEDVFEVPGGVAIVARDTWSARSAAARLEVDWDPGASKGVDTAAIRAGLVAAIESDGHHSARDDGDAPRVLDDAQKVVEAEYALPYLAHATMEPMNCTVVPGEDGCDVYMGTQSPMIIQDAVAHELGLSRSDVRVHGQYLGGGFGRRFFADMAAEAAGIARHTGKPTKLVWSREDDMARDFYRPPSLHRLRASLGADGRPEAWEHKLAAPSLLPHMVGDTGGAVVPQWMRGLGSALVGAIARKLPDWAGPVLAIEGAHDQPYAVPNVSMQAVAWDPGIPVGIWRSVGHSHNGFVVESFIDELAHAAGEDPAAYRRSLLADHPRHLAVLDRVVEEAGWGRAPAGRAQGIAVHEAFDSVVAQVAEVSVDGPALRVHRVVCAVDCGLAVNPDIVEAQMESAINFGLTAALYGRIDFRDGAAVQSNFHDHRMLRMADAPEIEVHILESDAAPTGVGEPGTPPIAPAVANAVFAATGRRLRELPFELT